MNKQSLTENIEALLDQLNSQADITEATQLLHKRFFEKALNAESRQASHQQSHMPSIRR